MWWYYPNGAELKCLAGVRVCTADHPSYTWHAHTQHPVLYFLVLMHCLAGSLHAEQLSYFPVLMHCLAGSLHAEQSSYFLVLMHSLPGRRPTCWTVILALCWALLLVNQSTLVLSTSMSNAQMMRRVGRTMYTWCKYSIFGREITK